jgi:RNA polymerase II subunit A small phosphatase-like protein
VRTSVQQYVKDLRRIGRCLSCTVLVDNDPFSGLLQPCNVVPVPAFYGDPSDRCVLRTFV